MWERRQARGHYRYFIKDQLSRILKTKDAGATQGAVKIKFSSNGAVKDSDLIARTPPVETALRFRD